MDEYDDYYEESELLDRETIIQMAFEELARDIKNCRTIKYSVEREAIRLVFANEPFGFEL